MNPIICPARFLSTKPPCGERLARSNCHVELCIHASRILESIRLVQLGARAGLVVQLTGLEKATVYRLYHQSCGALSPSGQMPFADTWFRGNDLRMLHATIAWRLHERTIQAGGRNASRFRTDVFETYRQLAPKPLLDLARTVFVPRLVAMRVWHEQPCEFYGTTYLAPLDSNSIACPGCRLYHRHQCHYAVRQWSLNPGGVGVWSVAIVAKHIQRRNPALTEIRSHQNQRNLITQSNIYREIYSAQFSHVEIVLVPFPITVLYRK